MTALSARRRAKTSTVIRRRLRDKMLTYAWSDSDKDMQEPHRLHKRAALGCRRSRCKVCHPYKYTNSSKRALS